MNFADMSNVMKQLPELLKMAPQAEQFMTAWFEFMNKLGRKLDYQEAKLETLDNRSAYIATQVDAANERLIMLMAETNLTPDLHDEVLTMSRMDPRNGAVADFQSAITNTELRYDNADTPG